MTRETTETDSEDLQENRPTMRIRVDENDRLIVTEANEAFLEMSGFNRFELTEQPFKKIEARDGELPEEQLVSAVRNNLGGRYVFRSRRPGDISYQLSLTVLPEPVYSETPETARVYACDYTQWKLWRPEREHELTGLRDQYFLRLYLSRMVRRAHRFDQTIGLVEIDVLSHGTSDESNAKASHYRKLTEAIRQQTHENDVLACRRDDRWVLIRLDCSAVDRSFDRFAVELDFQLSRSFGFPEPTDPIHTELTWCTYPESNAPDRMLGYELEGSVA